MSSRLNRKDLTKQQEGLLKLLDSRELTLKELKILLNTPKRTHISQRVYDHVKKGSRVKFGVMSDTHIGHKDFDEGLMKSAADTYRKEGIINVYHAGDILEGMSGREGHIYELENIGFNEQINHAEELLKRHFDGLNLFGIIGNHDLWYKKKNNGGVDVGEELDRRIPNFHYLGEEEADINFGDGITMKLFHPNDGTAYAESYKIQKMVESLEGGKKPNILVEGHYHKSLYSFIRNVHCIEAGTICGQTRWMRGKKIPAKKGFWIVEFEKGKKGIKEFTPRFFPSYQ